MEIKLSGNEDLSKVFLLMSSPKFFISTGSNDNFTKQRFLESIHEDKNFSLSDGAKLFVTLVQNLLECNIWSILLFLSFLLSLTSGLPVTRNFKSKVFDHYFNLSSDGSYQFAYDTGPGIHQSYREEMRTKDGAVVGSFGYVDPHGVLRITEYVADTRGYRATLSVFKPIPRVPPTRPLIVGPLPVNVEKLPTLSLKKEKPKAFSGNFPKDTRNSEKIRYEENGLNNVNQDYRDQYVNKNNSASILKRDVSSAFLDIVRNGENVDSSTMISKPSSQIASAPQNQPIQVKFLIKNTNIAGKLLPWIPLVKYGSSDIHSSSVRYSSSAPRSILKKDHFDTHNPFANYSKVARDATLKKGNFHIHNRLLKYSARDGILKKQHSDICNPLVKYSIRDGTIKKGYSDTRNPLLKYFVREGTLKRDKSNIHNPLVKYINSSGDGISKSQALISKTNTRVRSKRKLISLIPNINTNKQKPKTRVNINEKMNLIGNKEVLKNAEELKLTPTIPHFKQLESLKEINPPTNQTVLTSTNITNISESNNSESNANFTNLVKSSINLYSTSKIKLQTSSFKTTLSKPVKKDLKVTNFKKVDKHFHRNIFNSESVKLEKFLKNYIFRDLLKLDSKSVSNKRKSFEFLSMKHSKYS